MGPVAVLAVGEVAVGLEAVDHRGGRRGAVGVVFVQCGGLFGAGAGPLEPQGRADGAGQGGQAQQVVGREQVGGRGGLLQDLAVDLRPLTGRW